MTPTVPDAVAPSGRRWVRYAAVAVLALGVAAGIAFVLASVVATTRSTNERVAQVLERLERSEQAHVMEVQDHRVANQEDHGQVHREHRLLCQLIRGLPQARRKAADVCRAMR